MWIFYPGNRHQLLTETGVCLQQQIEAHCLYEKESWCEAVTALERVYDGLVFGTGFLTV